MKISILHFAAPPIIGGVESTIYHHASLLVARGYKVEVVAGRGEQFHPNVTFHQIPLVDSRHPKILAIDERLAVGQVPEEFNRLRDNLAGKLGPLLSKSDVCIVHNAVTLHKNLPLTAALRCLSDDGRIKIIAWCHDFAWQDELYSSDLHAGYPWDLLRSRWPGVRYVVVSEHRRERLARLLDTPATEIQVINPGVDIARFLKLEPLTRKIIERFDLLSAEPLMLLPARITRRKNIQYAIRVTACLTQQKEKAALVITGPPGPHNPKNIAYLESLTELCTQLEIADRVHFLHEAGEDADPLYVPDAVIADLYQLADALIFPSQKEGFGIPVLEAGLAHLPVFAADIPPIRESAADLAYLFDPEDDPESVCQEILNYFANDRAYQLRHRVSNHYTWEAIIEQRLIPLLEESNP